MPLRIEMDQYGGPEVLHPVDRPVVTPHTGEVLVRVAAAPVNRADCFIRSGAWPQGGDWPYVPGLELAGTIEAVGTNVPDTFIAGQRVLTMMQRLGGVHGIRPGSYQELACVPASTLARVPDGLSLAAASALGLPAVTALRALSVLDAPRGSRVLLTGASSAVGQVALQLLAAADAHVVATTTSPGKVDLLRARGAAEVHVSREPGWTGGVDPVDRVFDLVGAATFAAAVDLLAPDGRLVFVGGTSGGDLSFSGWALMRPITLTGYSTETLTRDQLQEAVDRIGHLVARGQLSPPDVRELPLTRAPDAHRLVESGDFTGRVILVDGA